MKVRHLIAGWMVAGFFFSACEKNPIEKLVNPIPDGAVPQSSGTLVIYDDEIKTGGGLGFIPAGENQSIDLRDQNTPHSGKNDIRYIWNGSDVGGQHAFAGFSLLITPDFTTFSSAHAKNLSSAGYTKLTFFVRGTLSTGTRIRFEGPDSGPPPGSGAGHTGTPVELTTLTNDWQAVSVAIPAVDFNVVKVFATFSFQYTQPAGTTNAGEGGIIYVDNIRYER